MNRAIPLKTKWTIILTSGLQPTGWVIFGLSLLVCRFIFANTDLNLKSSPNNQSQTTGVVISSQKVSDSVTEIYYQFTAENGSLYKDISYTDEISFSFLKGKEVLIVYPEAKPLLSRIKGMRRKEYGPLALLWLIFPIIGIYLIRNGLLEASKSLRILRTGLTKTVHKKQMNFSTIQDSNKINQNLFEFKAENGKSYEVRYNPMWELIKTNNFSIIYDPITPEDYLYVEALPAEASLDRAERIVNTEVPLSGQLALPLIFGAPHLIHTLIILFFK